jgi:pimeloyl-ACP methyl ester carboxylesterase
VKESPVLFGPDNSLVGIFTTADPESDICCLLANAGLMPRVGPHRLNVKIARALAKLGIPSLRFDLAGLGDSRPTSNPVSYRDQSVLDMRAAMDFVQGRYQKRRFVIFGICSGAENALATALADPRVTGILMLDGFWYRSWWSRPVRMWKRVLGLTPASFLRALRRRLNWLAPPAPGSTAAAIDFFPTDGSANPPREKYAQQMNELTARNVSVFLLYTSTAADQVSYGGQLRDAFRGQPFAEKIRCELHEDIDHTATLLRAQSKLFGIITGWVGDIAAGRGPRPEIRK